LEAPEILDRDDEDRRVDEVAGSQVLDLRVTEHVSGGRRQLAAIREGLAPVVRVHEPGDRDGREGEAAGVVEADHHMLAGLVHRNGGLGLAASRSSPQVVEGITRRRLVLGAVALVEADPLHGQ